LASTGVRIGFASIIPAAGLGAEVSKIVFKAREVHQQLYMCPSLFTVEHC
jgi:hypothetical protein